MGNAAITAALIGAGVSLVVAIYTRFTGRRDQLELENKRNADRIELEALRDRLEEDREQRSAWMQYQFEARKRLYVECEPLFFQLREACSVARDRVFSLADRSRQEKRFLEGRGHYLSSTCYQLLAPMAIRNLIQRQLTSVDLDLDATTKVRYELSNLLYFAFPSDHIFAKTGQPIAYDPNAKVSDELRESHAELYCRQGIARARLDVVAESLLKREKDGGVRCLTYAEFEAPYFEDEEWQRIWAPVTEIFSSFHPKRRPVLWRSLIAQVLLHNAIIECARPAGDEETTERPRPLRLLDSDEQKKLDWRDEEDRALGWEYGDPHPVAMAALLSRASALMQEPMLK